MEKNINNSTSQILSTSLLETRARSNLKIFCGSQKRMENRIQGARDITVDSDGAKRIKFC